MTKFKLQDMVRLNAKALKEIGGRKDTGIITAIQKQKETSYSTDDIIYFVKRKDGSCWYSECYLELVNNFKKDDLIKCMICFKEFKYKTRMKYCPYCKSDMIVKVENI